MQRSRLLSAAVVVFGELGYARTTVAHITARARVSRRTFYELFEDREDCLLAVLEDTVGLICSELEMVGVEGLSWRERVRTGLWSILSFFDREPVLARVCVVQSARGGQRVLEAREEIFKALAAVIEEGRGEGGRAARAPSLTAEGLVGAAVAILHKRLLARETEHARLSDLFGELMGMIVLPYLGAAVARREMARPVPAVARDRTSGMVRSASASASASPSSLSSVVDGGCVFDPLVGVPMRLTYRTSLVLGVIAERPGVSNRVVAELAGISDQGQVSKLLSRLARFGLIENSGLGHARGEANAWALTVMGLSVVQSIGAHGGREDRRAVGVVSRPGKANKGAVSLVERPREEGDLISC